MYFVIISPDSAFVSHPKMLAAKSDYFWRRWPKFARFKLWQLRWKQQTISNMNQKSTLEPSAHLRNYTSKNCIIDFFLCNAWKRNKNHQKWMFVVYQSNQALYISIICTLEEVEICCILAASVKLQTKWNICF